MIRRLILTLVVALGMFSTAEAAWDESRAAFLRGDYETAVREVRPLAEQGDAPAQFFLGDMYAKGRGVPQDDAEAAKWYREAAEQGVADAQYNLGVMYGDGRGVPRDYVQAHIWLNLAAAQGHRMASMTRNLFEKNMTIADVLMAQRLAREWKPKQ